MQIEYFVRFVYGSQLVYPACDKARALAAFAGCRTFTKEQVSSLAAAGVELVQVPDPSIAKVAP